MKKQDTIVVESRTARRRFIRAGAAFLLAGAASANAQEEDDIFRSDCDGVGYGGEKNQEMAQTDSDSGATADRPGCGRRKPTLTEYHQDGHKKVEVKKVVV